MKPWDGRSRANDPIVDQVPTIAPTTILTVTATGDASGITAVATPGGSIAGTTLVKWAIDGVVVETTQSLVYRFTTDSLGAALEDTETYSITAQPTNVAGDGTVSAPTNGQLNSGVASQTVLGWVAAGFLLAGTIQVGQMTLAPPTVDDPGGLTIPLTNGGVIKFPADGSDAVITAILRARSLVVEDNLRIQGQLNAIEGGLQLANGTTAPTVPPRAGTSWDHAAGFLDTSYDVSYGTIRGLYDAGTTWITTRSWIGFCYVDQIDKTTGVATNLLAATGVQPFGGVTKIGAVWFVLVNRNSDSTWWVRRYDSSWVFLTEWQFNFADTGGMNPAIATDGTDVWIGRMANPTSGSGARLVIRKFSTGGTLDNTVTTNLTDTSWSKEDLTGLYIGSADFGSVRRVATTVSKVMVANNSSTGSRVPTQEWNRANTENIWGLAWDGTRFNTVGASGTIWHYSTVVTATSRSITHTWYDNDAAGTGTHETEASPALSYSQAPRQWMRVDTDPPSFAGFPDDPNAVRIYVANKRQTDLATGDTTVVYDVPTTGGSAAPTSNGFAGVSAPGSFTSGATDALGEMISLTGAGVGWRLVGLSDPWTAYTPTWTGSGGNPALGNGALLAAYRQVGKTVDFYVGVTMGSTTTYGTGFWGFTLPVTPKSGLRWAFCNGEARDASPAGSFTVKAVWESSLSKIVLTTLATTAGNADRTISSTVPFTWANSDIVFIAGTYEAA